MVFNGNLNAIKLLHELDADLNALDQKGWIPLTLVVVRQQLPIIQLLHDLSADINLPHAKGMISLKCAEETKKSKVIQQIKQLMLIQKLELFAKVKRHCSNQSGGMA